MVMQYNRSKNHTTILLLHNFFIISRILLLTLLPINLTNSLLSNHNMSMTFIPSIVKRTNITFRSVPSWYHTSSSIIRSTPSISEENLTTSTTTTTSTSRHISSTTQSNIIPTTTSVILKPLIVCGPSGVGKGTIISKYMDSMGGSTKFSFTVSHTTRKPRVGEIDGIHYHFTDLEQMKNDITNGKFLEYAQVHGNFYGTSFESLSHVQNIQKKIPLLDIDVQGVMNIKEKQKQQQSQQESTSSLQLEPKYIFIAPPSMETLRKRLVDRGTESEESLEKRTRNAQAEMEYGMKDGNFDAIVVNDNLEKACFDFDKIIQQLYE